MSLAPAVAPSSWSALPRPRPDTIARQGPTFRRPPRVPCFKSRPALTHMHADMPQACPDDGRGRPANVPPRVCEPARLATFSSQAMRLLRQQLGDSWRLSCCVFLACQRCSWCERLRPSANVEAGVYGQSRTFLPKGRADGMVFQRDSSSRSTLRSLSGGAYLASTAWVQWQHERRRGSLIASKRGESAMLACLVSSSGA